MAIHSWSRGSTAIWSDSKIQEALDGAVRTKQVYDKNKNTPGLVNSAILKL